MKKLMRITLATVLLLSAGAPYAKPGAGAPAEFVRRAATLAAGDQFTLASSRTSSASWRRLLLARTGEQERGDGIRWQAPVWSAEELRIGLRGLRIDQQPRRNSDEKCYAYLQ